jgi:hypothetical protein
VESLPVAERPRRDDLFERLVFTQEIRCQNLDARARRRTPDRADGLGEMLRAAIREIVAVDRGDDDVFEAKASDGIGNAPRLIGVKRGRSPGRDVAEGASACANVAHDHHRCVPLLPAFPDVRARRLLANGMQPMIAHDRLCMDKAWRSGGTDAKPSRFRQRRAIRPRCLFRMAEARLRASRVEQGYQGLFNSAQGRLRA